MNLPSGVVTFLFTDIEGSSRLWESAPERMTHVLERHDALTRAVVGDHRGAVVKTTGDGVHAAFEDPVDAIRATIALQRSLAEMQAEADEPLRVRCGLHAGVAECRDGDFFGTAVNRAARIMDAAHGGQVLVSNVIAELARLRLPADVSLRDLGLVQLRDVASPERIFQVVHSFLAPDFPALRTVDATPNNLPRELTSFIGRDHDIEEGSRLLATARLLTLTGAGGIGKTRLALKVAALKQNAFPDGVWLVELGDVKAPELVPAIVGKVLAVREEANEPIVNTLTRNVSARKLLLVLDNCEHLTSACAHLCGVLLRAAPDVCILATSREPLRVAGEHIYALPALSVPDEQAAGAGADLERFEALRLFVERVRMHDPEFVLAADTAQIVARICRRLDGIPLAIELAAARARSLSVADIHSRLSDRFSLLTGGSRNALPRQQTLSALIAWSYGLLDPRERCLLERLSVFVGGFDLASAEHVCAAPPLAGAEILDLLSGLVDKSLVIAEPDGDTMRYRQLESIVAFSQGRHEGPDAGETRARHAAHFVNLARTAHPQLIGAAQVQWSARLEAEHGNLRSALGWSLSEDATTDAALELGALLYRFWHLHGHLSEGRMHLRAALAVPAAATTGTRRGDAQYAGGVLAYYQGDMAEAKAMLTESLASRRLQGAPREIAAALSSLANVLQGEGDTATARDYQEQALALFRNIGERAGEGICLINLGSICSRQAEYGAARRYLEQAVELGRATGHGALEGMGESNLGEVHAFEGDLAAADERYAKALAIARRIGDRTLEATSVLALGDLAARRRDFATACSLQQQGLAMVQALGVKGLMLAAVANAAQLLANCGRVAVGVRNHAAAAVAQESLALPPSAVEAEQRLRELATARAALGESAFAEAWVEGGRLPLEDVVALTLTELTDIVATDARGPEVSVKVPGAS